MVKCATCDYANISIKCRIYNIKLQKVECARINMRIYFLIIFSFSLRMSSFFWAGDYAVAAYHLATVVWWWQSRLLIARADFVNGRNLIGFIVKIRSPFYFAKRLFVGVFGVFVRKIVGDFSSNGCYGVLYITQKMLYL